MYQSPPGHSADAAYWIGLESEISGRFTTYINDHITLQYSGNVLHTKYAALFRLFVAVFFLHEALFFLDFSYISKQ